MYDPKISFTYFFPSANNLRIGVNPHPKNSEFTDEAQGAQRSESGMYM
ncbi:hypothetical protein [Methylotenera sp. 1P/1]|jgi:hypothetical protein|nr:hypothetical protein [Methylotenera sp. 1P/1]